MKNLEILRKRLLYQSQHRGMREMDLLLGEFAKNNVNSMNYEELKQFEALLIFPDQILYSWFFEGVPFPQDALSSTIIRIQKLATELIQSTCLVD